MNVFLSHANLDTLYMQKVVEAATFVGANVTFSSEGEGLSDGVKEDINQSHLVVCISTPLKGCLPEVMDILCYAQEMGKLILPISIGESGGFFEGICPLRFDESAVEDLLEGIVERFLEYDGWDVNTSFNAMIAAGAMVSALEQISEESKCAAPCLDEYVYDPSLNL